MIEILFLSAHIVLTVVFITMLMNTKRLSKEIDNLRDEFEIQRMNYRYNSLMFNSKIKELDRRLDQLEEVLDLKEYFDEEPLNIEENE